MIHCVDGSPISERASGTHQALLDTAVRKYVRPPVQRLQGYLMVEGEKKPPCTGGGGGEDDLIVCARGGGLAAAFLGSTANQYVEWRRARCDTHPSEKMAALGQKRWTPESTGAYDFSSDSEWRRLWAVAAQEYQARSLLHVLPARPARRCRLRSNSLEHLQSGLSAQSY